MKDDGNLRIETGSCFKTALDAARISIPLGLSIPNWVLIEELPVICGGLGLGWNGPPEVWLNEGEPIIIVYRTTGDRGHAAFVPDAGLLERNPVEIIGVIRFPSICTK